MCPKLVFLAILTFSSLARFFKYKDDAATVMKDTAGKNKVDRDLDAPTSAILIRKYENAFGVISQSTEKLLEDEPAKEELWANAVHTLRTDLAKADRRPAIDISKWVGEEHVIDLCFGLVKFFSRERNATRSLNPQKEKKKKKKEKTAAGQTAPSSAPGTLTPLREDTLPRDTNPKPNGPPTLVVATLISLNSK